MYKNFFLPLRRLQVISEKIELNYYVTSSTISTKSVFPNRIIFGGVEQYTHTYRSKVHIIGYILAQIYHKSVSLVTTGGPIKGIQYTGPRFNVCMWNVPLLALLFNEIKVITNPAGFLVSHFQMG